MTDEQQQQVRKILEAVANVTANDMTLHVHGGRIYGCIFCTMPNHVTHTNDCPVTQARLILQHL